MNMHLSMGKIAINRKKRCGAMVLRLIAAVHTAAHAHGDERVERHADGQRPEPQPVHLSDLCTESGSELQRARSRKERRNEGLINVSHVWKRTFLNIQNMKMDENECKTTLNE